MSRIEKLTPEQEALLPVYRDKWIAIGLSTEPADRKAAEAAIDDVYAAGGLSAPKLKVWLDSPMAGAIGVEEFRDNGYVWTQVSAKVSAKVCAQVRAQVSPKVWAQVWDQVSAKVRDQVRTQVSAKVWNQIWDQVSAKVWNQVLRAGYGSHDANWLGFYQYFQQVNGLQSVNKLNGLMRMAETCGWFWPLQNAVILTERHNILNHDDEGRLHRDGGLACGYPDGWGVYAWHGTIIPREWGSIKSECWKSEWLLKTNNAEHRRVLLEGIGYERIMHDLGSERIHQDGEMELCRIKANVDIEPIMLLKVRCPSTGSYYTLRVPPHMRQCETARRWTLGDAALDLVKET